MKHDRALAYAAFIVVCLVWGTTYLAIRIAVTTMTPFLLTGIRFLFAGIGMLIGFAGVALLVTPGGAGTAFDAHFVIGALAIQLGCIAWQYGTVRGKYSLITMPPLMSSALQMLAGGFVAMLVGLAL